MKTLRHLSTALCLFLALTSLHSQESSKDFDKYFCDETLRLDYVFAGTGEKTEVSLQGMVKFPGWAGRRHSLDKLFQAGNGQVTLLSLQGDTLYRNSFSSLYHEWRTTELSGAESRAMENCFLVPMPRESVEVVLSLKDETLKPLAEHRFKLDPGDILIRETSECPGREAQYILRSGSPDKCIDVVIAAEGYKEAEKDVFLRDAKSAVESILSYEPFRSKAGDFNFLAVFVPSEDSGVSIPRLGEWKSTVYSSNFSTFYSDRYLTTSHVRDLHNSLSGLAYEHIIILANTDEYGGGGIFNSYTLTTAHHPAFKPVVVHEFGHSFGGLADEYFYEDDVMTDTYPTDVEPWEKNVTTLVGFESKWKSMIPEGTPLPTDPKDAPKYPIGLYEGGAYSTHGVYRASFDCRMRTNAAPEFCPVCKKALSDLIDFYVR